jgi:hypothetical protein
LPQPPQFALSDAVFTHEPLHDVWPTPHWAHRPPLHVCDAPHALPHAPQCFGSFVRSTHVPPQSVSPLGHVHAPAAQTCPTVHAVPHAPQLAASDCTSVQAEPHLVSPLEQAATH